MTPRNSNRVHRQRRLPFMPCFIRLRRAWIGMWKEEPAGREEYVRRRDGSRWHDIHCWATGSIDMGPRDRVRLRWPGQATATCGGGRAGDARPPACGHLGDKHFLWQPKLDNWITHWQRALAPRTAHADMPGTGIQAGTQRKPGATRTTRIETVRDGNISYSVPELLLFFSVWERCFSLIC